MDAAEAVVRCAACRGGTWIWASRNSSPSPSTPGVQIYAQAFNVLNHMQWGDPGVNLQDPSNFGVVGGQYGALALGAGAGVSGANYTRIIQVGLRFYF